VRLLLKLEAKKDMAYDEKYFHKFQGFIYKYIEPYYKELHDKKGYKFFCFSNLFPIGDMKKGDERNWIISSPDSAMIKWLHANISEEIHLGEMEFKFLESKLFEIRLEKNTHLISATPITLRIPKSMYEKYGIKEEKNYVYWRPCYSFDAFVKQLEDNLFKKYKEFYEKEIEEFPIFERFLFKKDVCNHAIIDNKEIKIVGSMWEFIFSYLDKKKKEILEFGLDTGFGERNSLGFGFVNVMKKKL